MTEVEAAKREKVAKGEVVPKPTLAPKRALPVRLAVEEKVEEAVTLRAEVVAPVSETLPPPTALKKPAMVEDEVTERNVVEAEKKSAAAKCEVEDAKSPLCAQMGEVVAAVMTP